MSPPELARDAPIPFLCEPIDIGIAITLRIGVEGQGSASGRFPIGGRIDGCLGQPRNLELVIEPTSADDSAFDVRHLHKPLEREVRLDRGL